MFGFQPLEFAHEPVVLDVGDVRLVEDVVEVVGVVDQAAQFGDAGGGFRGHSRILGHRVWWWMRCWSGARGWNGGQPPCRSGGSRELLLARGPCSEARGFRRSYKGTARAIAALGIPTIAASGSWASVRCG